MQKQERHNKSVLDDIKKRLEKTAEFINNKQGRKIDLAREKIFVRGPFLHQDSDNSTEQQSAQFERENKELFNFLRSIDDEIEDIW